MNGQRKPWYKSRGAWGGLMAIVMAAANLPIQLDPVTGDFSGNIFQLATSLGGMAAGALAWYGRLKADTMLTWRR
jgi:hypothetical protein